MVLVLTGDVRELLIKEVRLERDWRQSLSIVSLTCQIALSFDLEGLPGRGASL